MATARRRDDAASLTPLSKHYKDVSVVHRDQPSIYRFRQRCKLFPHPVEIFSPDGIHVPLGRNYAHFLMNRYSLFVARIALHLPPLLSNQHIYKQPTSSTFPHFLYSDGDVIIGLKLLVSSTGEEPHLVFFEVRMDAEDTHATVLDPNGGADPIYDDTLRRFFGDIPYEVAMLNDINENDEEDARVRRDLVSLGFSDSEDMWVPGYCATISFFYLIDYICTDQWTSRGIHHFVRASREWLYSPEENNTGYFSTRATALRVIVVARYIAFRIAILLFDDARTPEEIQKWRPQKVTFQHRFVEATHALYTDVQVGDSQVQFVDTNPRSMSQLTGTYLQVEPTQLF